jgi:hypothetical protein
VQKSVLKKLHDWLNTWKIQLESTFELVDCAAVGELNKFEQIHNVPSWFWIFLLQYYNNYLGGIPTLCLTNFHWNSRVFIKARWYSEKLSVLSYWHLSWFWVNHKWFQGLISTRLHWNYIALKLDFTEHFAVKYLKNKN